MRPPHGRGHLATTSTYTLVVSSATSGCSGIIINGNPVTLTGDYTLVTPAGGSTHPTVVGV